MSEENVELVRRAYEAAEQGLEAILDVIDQLADPEIEFRAVGRLPDATDVVRGREAVKDWYVQLYRTFDFRVEAEELVDAGDAVVVVTRQIARGKASGAEITNRIAVVWGLRRGKLTYLEAYRTKREALEAVAGSG